MEPKAILCAEADDDGGYKPGHPWFYYSQGAGEAPLPFESIPPAQLNDFLASPAYKLPKEPTKRLVAMRKLLTERQSQLDSLRNHYAELVTSGTVALSEFDRTIMGRDPELAWAQAVAMAYNHTRYTLGCLKWTKEQLATLEPPPARQMGLF